MAMYMPTVQKQIKPTTKTCAIGVCNHVGYENFSILMVETGAGTVRDLVAITARIAASI